MSMTYFFYNVHTGKFVGDNGWFNSHRADAQPFTINRDGGFAPFTPYVCGRVASLPPNVRVVRRSTS